MDSHLQSLIALRADYSAQIARLDEIILARIQHAAAGTPGAESGAGSSTPAAPSGPSDPDYPTRRPWRDKISYVMRKHGQPMATGEIIRALRNAEGSGGKSVVGNSVSTIMHDMEKKGEITVTRNATGRKTHALASGSAPSDNGDTTRTDEDTDA